MLACSKLPWICSVGADEVQLRFTEDPNTAMVTGTTGYTEERITISSTQEQEFLKVNIFQGETCIDQHHK